VFTKRQQLRALHQVALRANAEINFRTIERPFRRAASAAALLEDALFELWRRRRGVWLTHQAYEENGGTST
jgi:hypothetical protein